MQKYGDAFSKSSSIVEFVLQTNGNLLCFILVHTFSHKCFNANQKDSVMVLFSSFCFVVSKISKNKDI